MTRKAMGHNSYVSQGNRDPDKRRATAVASMRRYRQRWGHPDRNFEDRTLREIGQRLKLPDQESVRKHLREHGLE